jgi:hypothetical protein
MICQLLIGIAMYQRIKTDDLSVIVQAVETALHDPEPLNVSMSKTDEFYQATLTQGSEPATAL